MQVKITRSTVAGKQFVRAGEVCDLADDEAKFLIQLGKAAAIGDAVEHPAEMTTETAQAVVEGDQPKRRGRKRAE